MNYFIKYIKLDLNKMIVLIEDIYWMGILELIKMHKEFL